MKRAFSIFLLLLTATACFGQAAQRKDRVQAVDGRAMGGQTISACVYQSSSYSAGVYTGPIPCTPTVTLYADPALGSPITAPLLTDSQGNYAYWLNAGYYTECVTGPNVTGSCYSITLPCAPSGTGCGGGGGGGSPGPPLLSLQANISGVLTGVPNSSYNTVTGALNLPLLGNPFIKPNCFNGLTGIDDGIRYASPNGNDSNDGCSWGSAKLTIRGALVSLPGGSTSPDTAGSGTVNFTDGVAGNTTAVGCGVWLIGLADPNYSSPPACWIKAPGGGHGIHFIGEQKVNYGPNAHMARSQIGGGLGTTRTNPALWISGVNTPIVVQNAQFNFQGRPVVIGEDSNGSRQGTTGGSQSITLLNVGADATAVAGMGPSIDIVGGSFWIYGHDISASGLENINTPGTNAAAAITLDGFGNDGIGLIYLYDLNLSTGGILLQPGTVNSSVNSIVIQGVNTESQIGPSAAVWFKGQFQQARVSDIQVSDQTGVVYAVRNDGGGPADNLVVEDVASSNTTGPLLGPMTVAGAGFNLGGPPITSGFLKSGFQGVISKHLIGTSDVSRRQFGPASVRFANSVLSPASYITIAGTTLTQNVADPSGGTGATRLTATGAAEGAYVASQSGVTTNVGDWFVYGAWVHSFTGNGYATSGNPLQIGLTSCTVTLAYGTQSPMPLYGGDGEWEWIETAVKIATVSGSPCQPNILASADATHTLDIFGPVYYHVPVASAPSDNEMLEIANNLQSYDSSCVVGTTCNVSTETLNVAGGLGCATKAVSSAYTLKATDCKLVVTGTTTITVPHAIKYNFWEVVNGDPSLNTTISPDSGTINGAGSITLAPDTGIAQLFSDGTNSWGTTTGSGGGGSSIFTSWGFGGAGPHTGTGYYILQSATAPIVEAETGSGTSGSPYAEVTSCPTCAVHASNYVEAENVIASNGTTGTQSSPAAFDCSPYTGGADWSADVVLCLAALPTANANALTTLAGVTTTAVSSVNPFSALTGTAALDVQLPPYPITLNAAGSAWSIAANDVKIHGVGVGGASTRLNAGSSFPASTPLVTLGTNSASVQYSGLSFENMSLNASNGPASALPFLAYNLQEFSEIRKIDALGTNSASPTGPCMEFTDPAGGGHYLVEDIEAGRCGANDGIYVLQKGAGGATFNRITLNNTGVNTGLSGIDFKSLSAANTISYAHGVHAEGFANTCEFGSQTGGTCDDADSTGTNTDVLHIDSGALVVAAEHIFGSGTNQVNDLSLTPNVVLSVANYANGLPWYTNGTEYSAGHGGHLATYSSAHTLNITETLVNVTGTTTITVPHALTGQWWDVFNSGSNTVTLSPDSGTIAGNGNAAASTLTVAADTGFIIYCDGTNCFALGGGGGSGGTPGGATDAVQYNAGGGTFGGTNSPVVNGVYGLVFNVTGSAAVAPSASLPGVPVTASSSSTPAIVQADLVNMFQTTNSTTSTATTVPAGSTLSASFAYVLCNTGTVVNTVTPTTSTINGNLTLKLQGMASTTNPSCYFSWTDPSNNYWAAVIPNTDANGRIAAAGMPAFTGDCTNSAGALALACTAINGTAFAGTTGHLVSFGATNVPADSGLVVANTPQQTSNGAANELATYTGANKTLVPGTANIAMGGTAATSAAAGNVPNTSSSTAATWTAAPILGVDNTTAGTMQFANGSANAHTIFGSGATTTNTLLGPATVPTTNHLLACTTSSTTCTLTDSGISDASPTGTGAIVLANTPTLITPVIGAATGTSLIVTGTLDGRAPVTITTGTTATLGAATYSSGYTLNQEGTAGTGVTYTLPATATGLQYCVANSGTTGVVNIGVLTVYPPSSSYVILNGVVNTVGGGGTHGVASSGAAGDAACFVAIDSTHWQVWVGHGTWVEN